MVANILKALPGAIVTFVKATIPYVKTAFNDLITSISQTFPIVGKMFDFIRNNAQVFKTLAAVIGGAIAGFAAFKGVATIFNVVKTAIVGLKIALLTNPFGLILAAVGALASGLIYLYKTNENVRNSIDNIIGKAKTLISNFVKSDSVTKLFSDGLQIIASIGDKVASIIGSIGKKASSSAGSVDWFGIAFTAIKTAALSLLGPIGLAIKAFDFIAKAVGGGDIQKGMSQMLNSFGTLAKGIKKNAPAMGNSFGSAIEGILTAISAALPSIVTGGIKIIAGFISGIAKGLPNLAVAAFQLITAFTASLLLLVPSIVLSATSIIVAFLGAITSTIPQIVAAAGGLVNALLQGITQQIPNLVASTAGLISTLLTSLNSHLPEILQAGINLLITFLQGIAQNIYKIVNTAVNLMIQFANALVSRMPDITNTAATLIASFINGIANNLGSIISAAVNLIVKFLSGIANKIPSIINAAMGLVDAMVKGVVQAQGRLLDAAINLINGFAKKHQESTRRYPQSSSEYLRCYHRCFRS